MKSKYHSQMGMVRLYAAMDLWEIRHAYKYKDYETINEFSRVITNYICLGIISGDTRTRYYKMLRKSRLENEKNKH